MRKISVLDSTLRDGAQGDGIAFSVQDKLNILRTLDAFGVDYIEAGNPAATPKDAAFFAEAKALKLTHARLCAFGSTAHPGGDPAADAGICALIAADTEVVSLFGKASLLHATQVLGVTGEENLALVRGSVEALTKAGRRVIFDAEHFFDGYAADPAYALSVIDAALAGGASVVTLCDTNGGTLPQAVAHTVETVVARYPGVEIGIHCHDDIGCAAASTIGACMAGASLVQGTFLGIGERGGNADLTTVLPTLMCKCGFETSVCDLSTLRATAWRVAEIANIRVRNNKPYIGKSAFRHKAGMHIDAVQKFSASFEHIDPAAVGNERKFLYSEESGRGTVLPMIRRFAPHLTKSSPEVAQITDALKAREFAGYQYEGAEASFELFVRKALGQWTPHFKVVMYKMIDDFPSPDGEVHSNAIIKVRVGGKTELSCGSGNGPVNALDIALRAAMRRFYPCLDGLQMLDYKVRVIGGVGASDAATRVLIEAYDASSGRTYTTVGVSSDLIEASFMALVDTVEYALSLNETK